MAIFPLLFLYKENVLFLDLGALTVLFLFLLLGTFLLLWIVLLLLKNPVKANLSVSFFYFFFFSYGHFHSLVGSGIRWEPVFNTGYFAALLLILFFLLRTRSPLERVNFFMSLFAKLLTATLLISIVIGGIVSHVNNIKIRKNIMGYTRDLNVSPNPGGRENFRDVYYIILDGYGRSDILKEFYQYDNGDFIDQLREMGFFVADRSEANYGQTFLSLSSSLNMIYLNDVFKDDSIFSLDRRPVKNMIRNNRVVSNFRKLGYEIVEVHSRVKMPRFNDVDRKLDLDLRKPLFDEQFFNLWFETTPLSRYKKFFLVNELVNKRMLLEGYRMLRHAIDIIPRIGKRDVPQFVFIHVCAPHPPFFFNTDGSFNTALLDMEKVLWGDEAGVKISREEYVAGYRNQIIHVSRAVLFSVKKLLKKYNGEVIVILQGDHGPASMLDWSSVENSSLRERLSILNAYYFPGNHRHEFYPRLSPVNSFRIIFNLYFGQSWPLLPDRSYFSEWERPYRFFEHQPDSEGNR